LMFGVAAGVLVMALAGVFAMPELTQYYSQIALSATASHVRLLGFSLIGLTILVAGVAGWLGVAVARGRPRARLFSWVLCGATACGAATVLVLQPWEVVPWLPVVLRIAAAVVGMQAVAIAVLLSQPLSGRFFGSSRDADRDDQGQPPTNLDPAPAPAPAVLAPTASALPDAPGDYDPFS
jgi:hypothetical protein